MEEHIEHIVWLTAPEGEGAAGTEHDKIARALQESGWPVQECTGTADLRDLLLERGSALLVAELSEAGRWEGWEAVAEVRENGRVLPVLVLSSPSGGEAAESAFQAGANDYMAYPLHAGELRARVANLLALAHPRRNNGPIKLDGLVLEPSRRRAVREGRDLKLTAKEFALLMYLAENRDEVCTREQILRQVWGYDFHAGTNVVDVFIRHLRLKVDKGFRHKLIHTVRGAGYVVKAPEEAPYS